MAEIEFVLNNNLEKLSNWANKRLITFNALKTEVILISNVFHDYNFEFKDVCTSRFLLSAQVLHSSWSECACLYRLPVLSHFGI